MKKIFEQPKLQVQTFAVEDQLLLSSLIPDIEDSETNILRPFTSASPFSQQ